MSDHPPPYFTDAEIAVMCDPLVQPAAQIRYLRDLGLVVNVKPNGRPLVMRSNAESVLGGLSGRADVAAPARARVQPDAAGLKLAYSRG